MAAETAGPADDAGLSVERPLWRALAGYRVLTACYAVGVFAFHYDSYGRPVVGLVYLPLLLLWTLATLGRVSSAARCTHRFLACDFAVALTGILLSPLADTAGVVGPTLPTIWTGGAVLAFAVKRGWRWAAGISLTVGAANVVEAAGLTRDTVHNVVLVTVASIGIGYVVEVARTSERALAEALRIDAATRERERLARDIHDGVLQVLAMVQRRGTAMGGEAAELGRLAGEQEIALRTLIAGRPTVPPARTPAPVGAGDERAPEEGVREAVEDPQAPCDLRELLAARACALVSFAEPGTPVVLPARVARTLDAAVGAALDNVRTHVGEDARAWVLLEDEPDAVLVSVRDEGPGIPAGRLADAESEGRLGVSLSIRGRLRELGGSAAFVSIPGQGTEVELKVPR